MRMMYAFPFVSVFVGGFILALVIEFLDWITGASEDPKEEPPIDTRHQEWRDGKWTWVR